MVPFVRIVYSSQCVMDGVMIHEKIHVEMVYLFQYGFFFEYEPELPPGHFFSAWPGLPSDST